jgi:hypothetical protein
VKLGKPENLTRQAGKKAVVQIKHNARTNKNNLQAAELIRHLRKDGFSFQAIASRLKWFEGRHGLHLSVADSHTK